MTLGGFKAASTASVIIWEMLDDGTMGCVKFITAEKSQLQFTVRVVEKTYRRLKPLAPEAGVWRRLVQVRLRLLPARLLGLSPSPLPSPSNSMAQQSPIPILFDVAARDRP